MRGADWRGVWRLLTRTASTEKKKKKKRPQAFSCDSSSEPLGEVPWCPEKKRKKAKQKQAGGSPQRPLGAVCLYTRERQLSGYLFFFLDQSVHLCTLCVRTRNKKRRKAISATDTSCLQKRRFFADLSVRQSLACRPTCKKTKERERRGRV